MIGVYLVFTNLSVFPVHGRFNIAHKSDFGLGN